jgi:hypothetical protein
MDGATVTSIPAKASSSGKGRKRGQTTFIEGWIMLLQFNRGLSPFSLFVGRVIGTTTLKDGGAPTSVIKVFTDKAGNLITTFPVKAGN